VVFDDGVNDRGRRECVPGLNATKEITFRRNVSPTCPSRAGFSPRMSLITTDEICRMESKGDGVFIHVDPK